MKVPNGLGETPTHSDNDTTTDSTLEEQYNEQYLYNLEKEEAESSTVRNGDFSEYMWMENEEEFNNQVIRQLEEEELMEQCIGDMLDEDDREPQSMNYSSSSFYSNDSTINSPNSNDTSLNSFIQDVNRMSLSPASTSASTHTSSNGYSNDRSSNYSNSNGWHDTSRSNIYANSNNTNWRNPNNRTNGFSAQSRLDVARGNRVNDSINQQQLRTVENKKPLNPNAEIFIPRF